MSLPPSHGLENLLEGVFDYAGMFAPASLPLDQALAESARSPRLRRPGIVGADMVVAKDQLNHLDGHRAARAGFAGTVCNICVVGHDIADVERAIAEAHIFNVRKGPQLHITAVEVHGTSFPKATLESARRHLGPLRLFVEPRWAPDDQAPGLKKLLATLAQLKRTGPAVGLKLRCVGPTAVTPNVLASAIAACATEPIPLKVTQGLHHPLPEARYGNELGFLPIAFAVRWAQRHKTTVSEIEKILAERDPRAFLFPEGGAAWHGKMLTSEDLHAAREDMAFNIGSCSLREPDDDLARLFAA